MSETENYSIRKALKRFYQLINIERKEITNIYFYAIISGIILLSLPLGIQAITNILFGGTVSTSLIVLICVVVFGVLINGILQIEQMRVTERIQQRIFTRLTFVYAFRIPKISLESLDDYYLPELVNRFFDTTNLQKGFSKLLLDFPTASIQIVFGLILLCFYHPLFIVFALIISILVLMIFYFTSVKGFRTSMKESDYKYEIAHWLEEVSRTVKTFKLNQHHEMHLERTDHLVDGYLNSRDAHFSVLMLQYKVLVYFKVVTTAAMLFIGSFLFINQQINLGQFIASEIIIISILTSIEKMIMSLEVVYDVLTSLEKLNKVLDKPQDEEKKLFQNQKFPVTEGIDIKINNLNFVYPNDKKVISQLNLHIKSGEKICLLGLEGSGKSTLMKLLAGFYADFSGNITFNDVPINMIPNQVLHERVSILLADEELFSGTLFENLTIGKKNIDFEHLEDVCQIVGLKQFVADQQKGYETYLDPQGRKLSYNIIQKILLARCLLLKPALLMVEDGWMGIEPIIRKQVIQYLTDKKQSFTLITITNDEAFANACDRKIMMVNGSIVS